MLKAMFARKIPTLADLRELRVDDIYKSKIAIEAVVELSSADFKEFSSHLLRDFDFIADNKDKMYVENGVWHCIVIREAGSRSGILVQSEGYDYARYSAFVHDLTELSLWGQLCKAIAKEATDDSNR